MHIHQKVSEGVVIKGHLKAVLTDVFGKPFYLESERNLAENHNLIVTIGKTALATFLASGVAGTWEFRYIGIGTDSTPAAVGQTALIAECAGGYTRQTGAKSSALNVLTITGAFGAGNPTAGATVTEYFIGNAPTAGVMWSRSVLSPIVKAPAAILTVTYNLTIG